MKSWKTKKGNEIFQVLSGRSNSYYVETDRHNILFDTGKASSFKKLRQNINILNPKSKNIDFLILTHTHFDHCQNAALIKKEDNCKIIMSKNEKGYVENGYTPIPKGTIFISKIIYTLGTRLGVKRFSYEPFTPDVLFDDTFEFPKEVLDLKIFETPGHSSGSICIVIDNEIAIVGDTLFGVFPNSIFPPFADNPVELKQSWQKLLKTNCDTFLPGHGKEIKLKYLKRKLWNQDKKMLNSF